MLKRLLLFVFISLGVSVVMAQPKYGEIAGKYFRFYNAQLADSIFFLYSPEFQEKLPKEKSEAVISGLHIQYGELKSLVLLKADDGFNVYKASFAHQTLSLLLSLNDESLIDGFRLVPYHPEQYPEDKK